MTGLAEAILAVRAAASEAGNASGSADRAAFLLEESTSHELVIESLTWARDQARLAASKADAAVLAVKRLAPNAN